MKFSLTFNLAASNVFLIDGVPSGTLIFEAYEETHFTLVLEGAERLI